MLEKTVESRLRDRLTKAGCLVIKFTSPGCDGVPDRLIFAPGGRIWLVELKTETGRLSAIQKILFQRFGSLGFHVRVLYGIDDVNAFCEEVENIIHENSKGGDSNAFRAIPVPTDGNQLDH